MSTESAPHVAAANDRDEGELYAEAAGLSRQYALGSCASAWLETSYLQRVVWGWIVAGISLISAITSLTPADWDPGMARLGLVALLFGGLLLVPRPRSRRVRLYLYEGGVARATNTGPGPRLAVLRWADLDKVTPSFDVDNDLTSCALYGRSGIRLVLGTARHDGVIAPEAILRAAERVLASRSPTGQ